MDLVHDMAGLSTSQRKIMRTLHHGGPSTVPEIATVLGVSRQFVQTVCNHLQDSELVEFNENPRHKRSKLVSLTGLGRTAFRSARQKENEIIETALPDIDRPKAAQACKLLALIRTGLEKSRQSN
jgi:DNA-binding MarR family transcriptional regulator